MPKKEVIPVVPMRLLRVATCPSLSGRSQLTYHIGCNAESEVSIRVTQNSGGGQFNANWVALAVIEKLLLDHPADKPMSARVLLPVFRSKSSNSPAFLFACCLSEGLVKKAGTEKDSGYTVGNLDAIKQAMSVLLASDIELVTPVNPVDTPASAKSKRTAKGSA